MNNAGTTHRNKPVMEISEAEFDRVYAVNVKSLYFSVAQFVPYFRKVGGGSFINVASTAGVRPRTGLIWYNGSKAAVIIASKALVLSLGRNRIRVNCINPVMGETGLLSEFMGKKTRPRTVRSSSRRYCWDGFRHRRASPTRLCTSHPMTPNSSPVSRWKWTVGTASDVLAKGVSGDCRRIRSIGVFPI